MHLAQLNLATALDDMDSPRMSTFLARIEEINAVAERAPGFVWRLKDEDGPGAIGIRITDDDRMLVNLSVWTDIESLREFVLGAGFHREALAARRQWFEQPSAPMTVCWYITEGHVPTLAEAEMMLERLRENGPTADLFPFTYRD